MKILVRIFIILCILSFPSYAYAKNSQQYNHFVINKIENLFQLQKYDESILADNGKFIDVHQCEYITKQSLFDSIKKNGYQIIFPNNEFFLFFKKFINKINNSNKNEEIEFPSKEKKYFFRLLIENDKFIFHVNVLENEEIEDFGFPEKSYIYVYEYINDTLQLIEINMAGYVHFFHS